MLLTINPAMRPSNNLEENHSSTTMQTGPTFRHFLHGHPLELTGQSPTTETRCSACDIPMIPGRNYYSCTTCSFSLHRPCFNLPQLIRHQADPNHELSLVPLTSFECKACGDKGSGFSYNCDPCQVKYHCLCMLMPLTKSHASHPHELQLKFSSPYGASEGFNCDLCDQPGWDHWLYRCDECGFDMHMSCSVAARGQQDPATVDPACYAPSAPAMP